MWDMEGKDADLNVIRKLLASYQKFFKENVIGRDLFLTYSVPNPEIEKAERKVLLEALETIPKCYDVAAKFYQKRDIAAPVFEVILPMTTSPDQLIRVFSYYNKIVAGKEFMRLHPAAEGITVGEWIGHFKPRDISVIPLIESMESFLSIEDIVSEYISRIEKTLPRIRVFLARSDPSLNYGFISNVLLSKLALSRLDRLEEKIGTKIAPIIGVGTLPFRGHLTPENLDNFTKEYAGIKTVTIQSALKYDYKERKTRFLISKLKKILKRKKAMIFEGEKDILKLIKIFTKNYKTRIERGAELINYFANFVPKRRERKLHIGLFGYSRSIGKVRLPRAIAFTCVLYSIGAPPEFIGMGDAIEEAEREGLLDVLTEVHLNFKNDIETAGNFCSINNLQRLKKFARYRDIVGEIIGDINAVEDILGIKIGAGTKVALEHEKIGGEIIRCTLTGRAEKIPHLITEMGRLRKALG